MKPIVSISLRLAAAAALIGFLFLVRLRTPPVIEIHEVHRDVGVVSCIIAHGGRNTTGKYIINGIEYLDSYGRVFGWAGRGCNKYAAGRLAEVSWVTINGDVNQRLALGVRDIHARVWLSGNEIEMKKKWERDIKSNGFSVEFDYPFGFLAIFLVLTIFIKRK